MQSSIGEEGIWIAEIKGLVAKLVRALVLWSESRGFELHQDHLCNGDSWWDWDTYMHQYIFLTYSFRQTPLQWWIIVDQIDILKCFNKYF